MNPQAGTLTVVLDRPLCESSLASISNLIKSKFKRGRTGVEAQYDSGSHWNSSGCLDYLAARCSWRLAACTACSTVKPNLFCKDFKGG